VYSINMNGGVRGAPMPIRHHVKTLAATFSRPNPEILAACEVLAHSRVMFHPYTYELHGDAAAVAATLIGYNDVWVAVRTTTRRRRS
jgi:hypothetical protein